MEILINKFTNKCICFYSLFKVRGYLEQRTVKGRVVEKKLRTTATEFIELQNDLDRNAKFLSNARL